MKVKEDKTKNKFILGFAKCGEAFPLISAVFPFGLAFLAVLFWSGQAYDLAKKTTLEPELLVFFAFVILAAYLSKRCKHDIFIEMCAIFACMYLAGKLLEEETVYSYTVICVYAFFMLVYAAALLFTGKITDEKRKRRSITLICVGVCLLLRVAALMFYRTQPVSDFAKVYNYASLFPMDKGAEAWSRFASNAVRSTYYAFESITLRGIFKLIGASVIKGQLINIAMSCSTTLTLLYVGREIFEDKKHWYLPAVLFSAYPASILNDLYFAHENYCSFFSGLFLLFIIRYYKSRFLQKSGKEQLFNLAGSALFLGLLNLYKPIGIVYLLAFLFMELVFWLKNSRGSGRSMLALAKRCAVLILAVAAISQIAIAGLESYIGRECYFVPMKSVVMGLNTTNGYGNWSKEIAVEVEQRFWKESGQNVKEYNKMIVNYLINDWKTNPQKVPKLLVNKFGRCWGGEGAAYVGWAMKGNEGEREAYLKQYTSGVATVTGFYAMAIYLLCIIGVAANYRKKEIVAFLSMSSFAFASMLMITEAQARYKSVFTLVICLLASFGAEKLAEVCHQRRKLNGDPS